MSNMHHSRRKKKRVNYGVKTIELTRGPKGFGFTISGQQPCILSCIVANSPAEKAGLRAGDYLVAVNNQNVSKIPHDDVVRLIGHTHGLLKLQIAENYYSDSSDEEGSVAARSKPKYLHKTRSNGQAGANLLQCRVAKVVRDLETGAMFGGAIESAPVPKARCGNSNFYRQWNAENIMLPPPLLPPPPPLHNHKRDSEKIVHRTVVGYLGTIDIPNQLHPSSMMQVLRKCIKRLRGEKRTPTTVLLTIHVANIKLTNNENRLIAEYPSHRIVFCSSFSDQDKQYFGILTKSSKNSEDIISNSCHVFTIHLKMTNHEEHTSICNIFGFSCTKSSDMSACQEFPDSCTGLVGAIQTLYISGVANEDSSFNDSRRHAETSSPQPSNLSTSTAHSSNSDSGIGFKDDYCNDNHSDGNNLLVFDYPRGFLQTTHRHLLPNAQAASKSREKENEERLTVRAKSNPKWSWIAEDRATERGGFTTCPGGPSAGFHSRGCNTSRVLASREEEALFYSKMEHYVNDHSHLQISISKSLGNSIEDINAIFDDLHDTSKSSDCRPWGSMQDIRKPPTTQSVEQNVEHGSTESCSGAVANQGVHTWSSSFEKLLEDPKGLDTFAEFLKKEFSHENIHFWTSCEKYMAVEDPIVRRKLASQIYQRHLSSTASEPVNVDSDAAGQITQELLNLAPVDLFSQSQKQVFNLMKFDSYPRFLRSDLYRRCLETANEGCSSTNSSPGVKLKKSHSDAEDRCRKSILPWNRKNRSKSKDRGESEYVKAPSRGETIYKSFTTIKRETEGQNNNEDNVSISSSRSSLASWDLALRQSFNKHSVSSYDGHSNEKNDIHAKCTGLCRVILPDGSTTVVPTSQTESVKDVVTRLLDKRALQYTIYDVIVLTTNEIVNLKCSSSTLAGQEVEVVPTKTLKVDLPSHRTITVVAHKGRTLGEVLKPLLNKYGYKLESCSVWNDGRAVSLDILAINAPARIVLSSGTEPPQETTKFHDESQRGQTTLDEITNKVFEELLVGKSTKSCNFSEGSCKSEDQRSESSSILSSKFFTRDSTLSKKKSKSKTTDRSTSSDRATEESTRSHAPLIAKWKNGVKLQLPSKFDDDLYEGLKRAQRSRLDDQRGTEINFELPDFLKDKENDKGTIGKKSRLFRTAGSTSSESSSKFYETIEEKPTSPKSNSASCSPRKAPEAPSDDHNTSGENLWDKTCSDMDQTVVENGFTPKNIDLALSLSLSPSKLSKPPPLPPKPKNLLANIAKSSAPANPRPFQKSNGVEPVLRKDV